MPARPRSRRPSEAGVLSPALRRALVTLLTRALAAAAPPAAPASALLTATHLSALPRFLALIPTSDLIALATGKGDADELLSVAEAGAAIVARAFPPGAIAAEEVWLGLEALQLFIDAAGLGGTRVSIQGGYRPVTGGFAGARGHI